MSTIKKYFLENLLNNPDGAMEDVTPATTHKIVLFDANSNIVLSTPAQFAAYAMSASSPSVSSVTTSLGSKTTLNVGTAANSTAVEYGDGYSHTTVLTLDSITQAIAGANLGFGKKIYDFPLGAVKCKRALINITMTAATDTTVGEVGLGTVVASGSITGLGGTATFENIVDGFANIAPAPTGGATQAQKECEADNPDGTSTALDLYLNFAGGWSATENIIITGTITLFWDFLGTF